jgi:hypothetical protein
MMKRFAKMASIGLLCAVAASLGHVQVAEAAPRNKPTPEEKTLKKDIEQQKKQIVKDEQQVHKDIVKNNPGRLAADEAKEAQDEAILQTLENEYASASE